jgi:hypothetical protein
MTVVDLWTVQIVRDGAPSGHLPYADSLAPLMAETEENLTDLLPPGYRARIRRWDHPDPDEATQEDEDA